MKKLNLYGQIASVLSALAILAGCSGQENTDDGFAEYVEAYTGKQLPAFSGFPRN